MVHFLSLILSVSKILSSILVNINYKECYLNYKLISEMIILYLLLSFGILYPNIISYIQYG